MASSDRSRRGAPADEPARDPRAPLLDVLPEADGPAAGFPAPERGAGPDEEQPDEEHFLVPLHPRRHGPLPFGVRVGIFLLGWLLILIGIAGLVLPGIQGVFTIVLGAALLSLDNELVYRLLRRCLQRWPSIWLRVESFRDKLHRKLHRFRRHS